MSRSKRERKMRWFDLGARALAACQPGVAPGYGCPLCLRLFPTIKGLTDEDVPPESVGGHPLVLTCKPCNDHSGHQLDHHIRTAENIREIGAGRRFVRARITQGAYNYGAEVTFGPEPTINISKGNDDRVIKALCEDFGRSAITRTIMPDLRITFGLKHDPWREEVAWLRVGYLYAFAAFGYRFTCLEALRKVRQQIRNPEPRLTPGLVRRITPSLPPRIILVREPAAFRSVLVCLGARVVFLPGLLTDEGFYDRLAAHALEKEPAFKFSAKAAFELPRVPRFALDLDLDAAAFRRFALGAQYVPI